jgi:hypothetical protein
MLATAMYKWEGLPNTISTRFIEPNLFDYGLLVFFHSRKYGYMISKATPSGMLNVYDEPISYHAYGNNGFTEDVQASDCVVIRNNLECIPTQYFVNLFCHRLYELRRTIDVNVKQQKTPSMITCEESQRLTLKNLMMKYEGNEPFIYGNKNIDLDGIKVFKLDAPFIADKLYMLEDWEWKKCLEMLGINNANTHKKERLNQDEVNVNNQLISLESDIMLMCREEACRQIKEKYGLDITVELREGITQEVQEQGGEGIE